MKHSKPLTLRFKLLCTALLLSSTAMAHAANLAYTVTAPDGTSIAVQETGDPNGQAIIFIHGLLGSHLSWNAQAQSPELQRYRLITYDLRGHGLSGKPERADAYTDGSRWADDLSAVIRESGAHQPVLVGWSLGAAVATNYLAKYGDTDISGALYVGGVVELNNDQIQSQPKVYNDLNSDDLKTHLDAERDFVALCFEKKPDITTFERLIAGAAMASTKMQKTVHGMTIDASSGLTKMRKPLVLLYGKHDALVKPETSTARAMFLAPHAIARTYAESGHAPFAEEVERFNRDLREFVSTSVVQR